jgi:hypothetical protein
MVSLLSSCRSEFVVFDGQLEYWDGQEKDLLNALGHYKGQ